ncbi:MAG: hypothetical protein FRX49_07655 [Trebouxia sp. A1-2]|nr:MAG: hypothetical protein FRX49_07655 [Trebouxia sp. A1-2]
MPVLMRSSCAVAAWEGFLGFLPGLPGVLCAELDFLGLVPGEKKIILQKELKKYFGLMCEDELQAIHKPFVACIPMQNTSKQGPELLYSQEANLKSDMLRWAIMWSPSALTAAPDIPFLIVLTSIHPKKVGSGLSSAP